MSKSFTAKVVVESKVEHGQQVSLQFRPDYDQGRNAEWAEATPALALGMTVKNEVAEQVEVGDAFTLTFSKD
jgi:hypothetical protein